MPAGGGGGGNSQNDNGFLSPRGRLVADDRTNTLMVSDIPKKIAQIKELVRVIDRPVDQVIIEARIVIATETLRARNRRQARHQRRYRQAGRRSSLRLRWYRHGLLGQSAHRAPERDAVGDQRRTDHSRPECRPAVCTNPAGSLALSILNAGYLLDVELSAMQEEGRGEVISNPRVVTSNQREAVIRQGQEVGYVTITPSRAAAASPSRPCEFKDVLLEMKVTPTITNDGRVFLNMNVKKDEVEGFVEASIGSVPQINKREVNTAVLIEDGQTVVIGGVYEFRDRSDIQKVPFLGDVPFLGNLFKKKGKTKEKAELLIFVTPKVLQVAQR